VTCLTVPAPESEMSPRRRSTACEASQGVNKADTRLAAPGSGRAVPADSEAASPSPNVLQLLLDHGDSGLLVAVLSAIADPAILASTCSTCKALAVAGKHPRVWSHHCHELWSGGREAYVPQRCRQLLAEGRGSLAFSSSLADACRTHLTVDELTSLTWQWRFKAAVGEEWLEIDPWWQGSQPLTSRFQPDGRVVRLPRTGTDAAPILDDSVAITWRFCNKPDKLKLPRKGAPAQHATPPGGRSTSEQWGQYLRFTVAGRLVPTYRVIRHPDTWAWILESCWAIYASCSLPPIYEPQADPTLLDDSALLSLSGDYFQSSEVFAYNHAVPLDLEDQAWDISYIGLQGANVLTYTRSDFDTPSTGLHRLMDRTEYNAIGIPRNCCVAHVAIRPDGVSHDQAVASRSWMPMLLCMPQEWTNIILAGPSLNVQWPPPESGCH
jgi:hypothetical protein